MQPLGMPRTVKGGGSNFLPSSSLQRSHSAVLHIYSEHNIIEIDSFGTGAVLGTWGGACLALTAEEESYDTQQRESPNQPHPVLTFIQYLSSTKIKPVISYSCITLNLPHHHHTHHTKPPFTSALHHKRTPGAGHLLFPFYCAQRQAGRSLCLTLSLSTVPPHYPHPMTTRSRIPHAKFIRCSMTIFCSR